MQQIQDFLIGQPAGESSEWSLIDDFLMKSETNIKALVSSKLIDILSADKAYAVTNIAASKMASLSDIYKVDKTTNQLPNILGRQLQDIIENVTAEFKDVRSKIA